MPLHHMPGAGARHTLDALGGSATAATGPGALSILLDGVAGSSASLLLDWNSASPWMWVGVGVYIGALAILAGMAWHGRASTACSE